MKAPLSILTISLLTVSAVGLHAQQSKYVYTNDDTSDNTVSAFLVDTATGALSGIQTLSTGGSGSGGGAYAANRIAVTGNHLYASNDGSGSISAFSIDPNSGFLTALGSPLSIGAAWADISLAASPDGKLLFAGLAANNTVAVLNIATDGALSLGSSAALPAQPAGVKASGDGHYLAVGMPGYSNVGGVAMFSIAVGGALSPVTGSPLMDNGAGNTAGVDIDCATTHVFGGEMGSTSTIVDVYSIAASGSLSRIQGSPFIGGGSNSNVVLLSPNDRFLFVSNQFSKSVTVFQVGNGAALSLVAGSPFTNAASAGVPAGMATDQSGTQLYVATNTNQIQVFNIAADGTLSSAPGAPFSTGQSGGLLSLAAYPAKTCSVSGGPGPVPPPPEPPPPPPTTPPPPGSAMTVKIDIRPQESEDHGHESEDHINTKSNGKIRVAILSTVNFDAPARVDMTSLTFGRTGDEKSLAFCHTNREDVNHDRRTDLVCFFQTSKTAFKPGDTFGILRVMLTDHQTMIVGTDSIRTEH